MKTFFLSLGAGIVLFGTALTAALTRCGPWFMHTQTGEDGGHFPLYVALGAAACIVLIALILKALNKGKPVPSKQLFSACTGIFCAALTAFSVYVIYSIDHTQQPVGNDVYKAWDEPTAADRAFLDSAHIVIPDHVKNLSFEAYWVTISGPYMARWVFAGEGVKTIPLPDCFTQEEAPENESFDVWEEPGLHAQDIQSIERYYYYDSFERVAYTVLRMNLRDGTQRLYVLINGVIDLKDRQVPHV